MQIREFNEIPNNPFLDHPTLAIINLDKQFRIKVSTANTLNNWKIKGSIYCCTYDGLQYLWSDGTIHSSMFDPEKSDFPGWFAFLSDVIEALELYQSNYGKNRHDSLQTQQHQPHLLVEDRTRRL